MNAKEISKKIREDYKMITSLAVNTPYNIDDTIELVGMEYEGKKENGFASEAQIKFLSSMNNVRTYSDLTKTNKWFLSACIKIAKEYPDQDFEITI